MKSTKSKKNSIIIGVSIGLFILIVLAVLLVFLIVKKKFKRNEDEPNDTDQSNMYSLDQNQTNSYEINPLFENDSNIDKDPFIENFHEDTDK